MDIGILKQTVTKLSKSKLPTIIQVHPFRAIHSHHYLIEFGPGLLKTYQYKRKRRYKFPVLLQSEQQTGLEGSDRQMATSTATIQRKEY